MSLRRRVLLAFLVIGLALVVTNVALSAAFEDELVGRTDDKLLETAGRPVFGPRGPGGPDRGPRNDIAPLSDLYIGSARADGSGLTRRGQGFDATQAPPAPSAEELTSHDREPFTTHSADGETAWRVVAVPDNDGDLLVLAEDLSAVNATLARIRLIQVAGSVAVLAALGAVLWWVLRLGVRPLVAMASTADEIAAGDLSRRVDAGAPGTEAGRLGLAFNAMLTEIEEAIRDREASAERLRRFAADASHELRTPLTSIRGYAELWEAGGLRGEGELDQAMRRQAEEGRRMGALVEDLLLLARLDEDRPRSVEPVRLDALAADGVADALAVEPDRSITVDATPVTVEGDEHQLRQVVANLVTNARVHTPPGTPVHVSVAADAASARLEVADEGPGMATDVAERVFERFFRGDDSRVRSTGGSGLGLSIVDAVVRAHGGRVSVTSAPGEGTRFVVELPLAQSGHSTGE